MANLDTFVGAKADLRISKDEVIKVEVQAFVDHNVKGDQDDVILKNLADHSNRVMETVDFFKWAEFTIDINTGELV